MTQRIETIDLFKGITILAVMNIHTVWHSGSLYIPDWAREVSLLWDVSIFFIISGFLIARGGRHLIFRKSIRQLVRIYYTYLIAAALALAVAVVIGMIKDNIPPFSPWRILYNILIMRPCDGLWFFVRVFPSSLWYLQTYFCLLPLGVGILFLKNRALKIASFLCIIIIWLVINPGFTGDYSSLRGHFTGVLFFLAVFLVGSYTNKISMIIRRIFYAACLGCIFMLLLVSFNEHWELVIQENKFPPSIAYVAYILPSYLIFTYLFNNDLLNSLSHRYHLFRFICWCGQNSLYIYLYQGIAASLPFLFVNKLIGIIPSPLIYLISLLTIFFISLTLSSIHISAERRIKQIYWQWKGAHATLDPPPKLCRGRQLVIKEAQGGSET